MMRSVSSMIKIKGISEVFWQWLGDELNIQIDMWGFLAKGATVTYISFIFSIYVLLMNIHRA